MPSKVAAGKMRLHLQPYDLKAVVTESVQRYSEFNESFSFKVDIQAIPDEITGDARLMENMVWNLISNAIKYSGESRQIDIRGQSADGMISLSVMDHGIGIPAKDLDLISTRFFRASNSTGIQGTGIGLNFVNELAVAHQGNMQVESVEGEWTCVTLYLPIAPEIEGDRQESENSSELRAASIKSESI